LFFFKNKTTCDNNIIHTGRLKLDSRFDGNKFEKVASDDLVYTTHGKHQGILEALLEDYRCVDDGESCFILLKDALPPCSRKI
jgi:hypothetical protein